MRKLLLLPVVLMLANCASIVEGRSQEIMINTSPENASCKLTRKGEGLGMVNPTPGSIYIEKTKYDITIKCSKNGYEDATYLNHSGTAGAAFGNAILGGLIGAGIDSATGADNKYDSPVNITLSKK